MKTTFTLLTSTLLLGLGVFAGPLQRSSVPPPPPPADSSGLPSGSLLSDFISETPSYELPQSNPRFDERGAIIRRALDEAARLELRNDIDGALAAVSAPLVEFDSTELRGRRAELAERRLLRLATDAELNGRSLKARDLYIQALGVRGNQPGIAQRIRDLEIIADADRRASEAEAHARELLGSLESSQRRIADLQRGLRDFDATAERLDRDRRSAEDAARRATRDLDDLRRCIRDLERDNQCLERDLYNAKCEADRWRRKYEHARHRH